MEQLFRGFEDDEFSKILGQFIDFFYGRGKSPYSPEKWEADYVEIFADWISAYNVEKSEPNDRFHVQIEGISYWVELLNRPLELEEPLDWFDKFWREYPQRKIYLLMFDFSDKERSALWWYKATKKSNYLEIVNQYSDIRRTYWDGHKKIREMSTTLGKTWNILYSYDEDDRLAEEIFYTGEMVDKSTKSHSHLYTYQPDGNISKIVKNPAGGLSQWAVENYDPLINTVVIYEHFLDLKLLDEIVQYGITHFKSRNMEIDKRYVYDFQVSKEEVEHYLNGKDFDVDIFIPEPVSLERGQLEVVNDWHEFFQEIYRYEYDADGNLARESIFHKDKSAPYHEFLSYGYTYSPKTFVNPSGGHYRWILAGVNENNSGFFTVDVLERIFTLEMLEEIITYLTTYYDNIQELYITAYAYAEKWQFSSRYLEMYGKEYGFHISAM